MLRQPRALVYQVLAVVHDDQAVARLKVRGQGQEQRGSRYLANADALRKSANSQGGIRNRGQLNKPNTIREAIDELRRQVEGYARLAQPARSGDGHQATLSDELLQRRELDFATQETGELRGQVGELGIERFQHREVVRKIRVRELENAFGTREVLEPVRAEVEQRDRVREAVDHKVVRRPGKDRLPAIGCRHQPSTSIDGRSEVVSVA